MIFKKMTFLFGKEISQLLKIICFFCLILTIVYVIVAIVLYDNLCRSVAYYTMILLPLASLLSGITAVAINKGWILVSSIFHVGCICYIGLRAFDSLLGFIPLFVIYISLSIISGISFQKLQID